ncbi:MAG: hypothetical protein PHS80_00690 [Methanothrix sp.]|nr:hypothetical protein [Methanothrix sp.]
MNIVLVKQNDEDGPNVLVAYHTCVMTASQPLLVGGGNTAMKGV